ncbi:MAG: protein kinase [Deltaproteobacteria bacterium]|nr:protein kinase [Deltaproteobacteria bacterium]
MTNPAGTVVPRDSRDFGSYELIAKLATGGMAEIFLARRTGDASKRGSGSTHDELVVVKRILPHLAEDEHFVTMFRDEARLASRLEHANVGKVHSLGHLADQWFIVMEYLHGVPLSRLLTKLAKARQFLDVRLVAAIIIQACAGLHHAHELTGPDGQLLGVVHRDVSPPNIFVTDDGVVKLLDFGIAKARGASSKTRTGTVKGKNAYMSPEQILGKPLDRRSDVFALGAVMYELLAVKRLFHRDSDFMTFKAITEEPIPDIAERRPDLPAPLRAALMKSLARDPAGRFNSAAEMGEAVKAAVAALGGPAVASQLAAFVKADFAEDLAAKAQLTRQAADSSSPGSPLASAILSASSGSLAIAPTAVAPSPSGPVAAGKAPPPVPRGRAAITRSDTEEIDSIDGELVVEDDAADVDATRPLRLPARDKVVVAPRSNRATTPPVEPLAVGTTPLPRIDPNSFAAPTPAAQSMIDLADPSTDLLADWRKQRVRKVIIAGGIVAAVLAVLIVAIMAAGGSAGAGSAGVAVVVPAPTPDAMPDAPVEQDAGMSRDDIEALSKYGFLSIDANAKTIVYIDSQRIGEAPLTRVPLAPGVHHIKLIGPKSKVKRFDVSIFATKDTDPGTIEW